MTELIQDLAILVRPSWDKYIDAVSNIGIGGEPNSASEEDSARALIDDDSIGEMEISKSAIRD